MKEWYGEDKVAFVKIDGNKIRKLADMYKVPSYPFFVGVVPNTNGKTFSAFKYSPRNYDTMKKWMLEIMGNTPLRSSVQTETVPEQSNFQ